VQDLFACYFSVDGEPDATFGAVAQQIAAWAWRGSDSAPDLVATGRGESVAETVYGLYTLRWELLQAPDGPERVLEVELRHPDMDDKRLEWQTHIELTRREEQVGFTLRITREATEYVLRPARFDLRQPRLVPLLLKHWSCNVGGVGLNLEAQPLFADDVDNFVETVLRADSRRLPVVIVSERSTSDVMASAIASKVAGLAHVAVLRGYLAWQRLKEALPESYVPLGGLRSYWPGFGIAADTLRHPFMTSGTIHDLPVDQPVGERLFVGLARLSVLRVPRDPFARDLRQRLREQRIEEAATRAREAASLEEVNELYEQALREAESGNTTLREERQGLLDEVSFYQSAAEESEERLEELKKENERLLLNLREVTATATFAEVDEGEGASSEPKTWAEFAELVEFLESPSFRLTDQAKEELVDCTHPDPAEMWRQLQALAAAADSWATSGGKIGMRFDEWVQPRFGIEVALHDNALKKQSFTYAGHVYTREKHVKVNDHVKPNECGRIYFDWNNEQGFFIVDHIGLHL
jgi:hypothetical protein